MLYLIRRLSFRCRWYVKRFEKIWIFFLHKNVKEIEPSNCLAQLTAQEKSRTDNSISMENPKKLHTPSDLCTLFVYRIRKLFIFKHFKQLQSVTGLFTCSLLYSYLECCTLLGFLKFHLTGIFNTIFLSFFHTSVLSPDAIKD